MAYDFGADAVLLIARILDDSTLCAMANRARELGMTPFVEVRTEDDIRKLKLVQKDGECVAGVNARDLRNFHIDPLIPAAFRKELGPRAVFESGVKEPSDAAFARRLGFEGILIGEAAAKSPDSAKNLVSAFLGASQDGYGKFWKTFAEKREEVRKNFPGKPLVKICGITNEEDAVLATELGADMLGFMFYNPSPRKTNEADTRRIVSRLKEQFKDKAPLCVGVVADRGTAEEKTAFALAKEGVLDAIQFHGVSISSEMENANFGYYAAVRLKSQAEAESLIANSKHSLPRTLVDAYVPDVVGGTGKRIDDSLLDAVRAKEPLWMAGGISSENISEIVIRFEPELVDLSTSLEASHGKKSAEKLRAFFKAVR